MADKNIIECNSNKECIDKYGPGKKCSENKISADLFGEKRSYIEQICMDEKDCGTKTNVFGVSFTSTCMPSAGE